jgi:hypothetical protein
VETKRRLPVLKTSEGTEDDAAPARTPWQWVAFGALAIFAVWLPLAFVAAWVASRLAAPDATSAEGVLARAAPVAVLAAGPALAGLAGGWLVGRWGAAGVGLREAALAGLAAATIASALAFGAPGALWGAVIIVLVAVPSAALGGALGLRRRRRRA